MDVKRYNGSTKTKKGSDRAKGKTIYEPGRKRDCPIPPPGLYPTREYGGPSSRFSAGRKKIKNKIKESRRQRLEAHREARKNKEEQRGRSSIT